VIKKNLEVSVNEYENQVEITFNTNKITDNTIVLSGNGSIKVLAPV